MHLAPSLLSLPGDNRRRFPHGSPDPSILATFSRVHIELSPSRSLVRAALSYRRCRPPKCRRASPAHFVKRTLCVGV